LNNENLTHCIHANRLNSLWSFTWTSKSEQWTGLVPGDGRTQCDTCRRQKWDVLMFVNGRLREWTEAADSVPRKRDS